MIRAEQIRERILELARSGGIWEPVPTVGLTIRRTQTQTTPDYARKPWRENARPLWDQDTYSTYVFVTLVGRKVILGVSQAPWVGFTDRQIPLWLADLVLLDPSLALDPERMLAARREHWTAVQR